IYAMIGLLQIVSDHWVDGCSQSKLSAFRDRGVDRSPFVGRTFFLVARYWHHFGDYRYVLNERRASGISTVGQES
ncbi:MAG: hypothetical protein OES09_17450, partial [Gammaproteobacteria bacterium]|nr:hypothetical protein [Gammaproteobacteria bacterium]